MAVAWVITMVTGLDYVREALRLRRRAHARDEIELAASVLAELDRRGETLASASP